jgi:hypothetical protein
MLTSLLHWAKNLKPFHNYLNYLRYKKYSQQRCL